MMTIANAASPGPTTSCTKRPSATDGAAGKPSTGVMNCMRRGNAAGANAIVGGMKMATAGTPIATGTIAITTVTNL